MLTVENLQKSYGDKVLFQSLDFTIRPLDRIGLIGVNGTGKSSLLKIIASIETADQGTIKAAKDYRIEYLAQDPDLDPALTVLEQIYQGETTVMQVMRDYEKALMELEADPMNEGAQNRLMKMQQAMDEHEAWEANTKAKTILTKLGIKDFQKKIGALSGGQQKRVALANALIQPADLLILDEPTNHLDNVTIEWLETYLTTYQGALLLVTHDRYFLNRVTNRIYELDHGVLYTYEGNYEVFLEKKAEREEVEAKEQQKHRSTLRRELAWLRRGARARTTKQKARIERVEELQDKKFTADHNAVDFQVGSTRLGNKVVELKDVAISFDGKQIIAPFSRLIKPGDRIGIIGPNGTGKTTLLQIIAGRLQADQGEVEVGETVKFGYYTQGDEELNGEKRIIEYIKDVAEVIYTKDGRPITAEQMLEHFLFSRAEQWTYIRRLSGGEKRRLYLLKILMTEPNVLLLDEPTNDLDTQTLGVLEEYLQDFPGVVITVSHDRYFLDRIVEELLVFTGSGSIKNFYGNYSEFLEKEKAMLEEVVPVRQQPKAPETVEKKKKKLSYMEQREWDSIENEIMELEEKQEALQVAIAEAGSDFDRVQELFAEQQEVDTQLEIKMERWEELSLLVEELK